MSWGVGAGGGLGGVALGGAGGGGGYESRNGWESPCQANSGSWSYKELANSRVQTESQPSTEQATYKHLDWQALKRAAEHAHCIPKETFNC